jgi:hypothetical protein
MSGQLFYRKSFIEEGSDDEIRWSKEAIGQSKFFFLNAKQLLVIGVLIVGRQDYPNTVAFLLDYFISKPRMGVLPLQEGNNPEPRRFPNRSARRRRPHMDEVYFVSQGIQLSRHQPVMQCAGAQATEQPIRDPKLLPRVPGERGSHFDLLGQ